MAPPLPGPVPSPPPHPSPLCPGPLDPKEALRQRVGWEGFWTFLGSKFCPAPARDTLWRLFHGGLYTADRLAHIDPRHSRLCCCCLHWVETGAHPLVCSVPRLVWNKVAWIGRDWLEELWERLPPTMTVGGRYLPLSAPPTRRRLPLHPRLCITGRGQPTHRGQLSAATTFCLHSTHFMESEG